MNTSLEFKTINMYQDGLNGASKRHEVISNNLSNINTPGYKRKDVAFKKELSRKYMGDDMDEQSFGFDKELDSSGARPRVFEVDKTSMRNDDNNVDPDRESAKMAKNTLYYTGLGRLMRQQFSMLESTIQSLNR